MDLIPTKFGGRNTVEKNKIIFFDLDGVLIANKFFTTYYLDQVLDKLMEKNIIIEKTELLKELFNLFNSMLISKDQKKRVLAFDWDELVKILFNKYDLKWDNKIEQFYKSTDLKNYVHLYPDALNALHYLTSKGYQMFLVSNGLAKYQEQVIKILGLDKYFVNIILPDSVNDIKPKPGIFEYAISKCQKSLNEKCNELIFIGDSIYFDVYGANLCGFESILLYRALNRKMRKLPIKIRTEKFNEDKKILRYLKKDLLLSRFDLNNIDINLLKPNKVIYSLDELKLFL